MTDSSREPGEPIDLDPLRQALPRLKEEYGLSEVSLFGSVARGEPGPESDVDVLVEFQGTPTLFTMGRLKRELEEVLGREVDIATPGGLRPQVLERARRDAVRV